MNGAHRHRRRGRGGSAKRLCLRLRCSTPGNQRGRWERAVRERPGRTLPRITGDSRRPSRHRHRWRRVICFSDDGQKQLWSFEDIGEQAMVYSSPAIAQGIAVVRARDRNVYGLDLSTGKKKWIFATRGDVDSSPVISGDRVYVGSKDKHLYVLDLHSGKKLADFVASRGITATPSIGEGVLVIGDTGGNLYCMEPAAP